MAKISAKNITKAQQLLEQHASITEGLGKLGKRGIFQAISITSSIDSSNYTDVSIDRAIAKASLLQMKASVEASLTNLGVEISS